ncbi:hypothetical protein [Streptomyces sp. NBC_00932]|uniref:hypothetical protein n=1 Tax=Streptomyces sp. NBC_00932 TaxID=2903690 RepID=UPI00386F3204|nr:hypothetical protein OG221_27515 [Streptomyces sp. NBC_00932]
MKNSLPSAAPGAPKPKPARDEAKARVQAGIDARRALPARDYILSMLSATRSHAEAEAMVAEVEAKALEQVTQPGDTSTLTARASLHMMIADLRDGARYSDDTVNGLIDAAFAESQTEARAEIAADFVRQGKASGSLTWGQAHEIALQGLCSCSGGIKPCDMGGAR